jgi:hypothetical protein
MADLANALPRDHAAPFAAQSSGASLLPPLARISCATEHHLHYGGSRKPIFRVVADAICPGMWRVVLLDGSLSDMANLTRAKDAAFVMADRGPPRRNQSLLHWKTSPTALRSTNQPN